MKILLIPKLRDNQYSTTLQQLPSKQQIPRGQLYFFIIC